MTVPFLALACVAGSHQVVEKTIEPEGGTSTGVADGVSYTPEDARAVLLLANEADPSSLVAVLQPATVEALVAGRPYASLEELAEKAGVVRSTWVVLRDLALPTPEDAPAELHLSRLAEGYTIISESEGWFDVHRIVGGGGPVGTDTIRDLVRPIHVDGLVPLDGLGLAERDATAWFDDQIECERSDPDLAYWGERELHITLLASAVETHMPEAQLFLLGEADGSDLWGEIDAYMVDSTVEGDLLVLHWQMVWT